MALDSPTAGLLFSSSIALVANFWAIKAGLYRLPPHDVSRGVSLYHLLGCFFLYFAISSLLFPFMIQIAMVVHPRITLASYEIRVLLQLAMIALIALALILFVFCQKPELRKKIFFGANTAGRHLWQAMGEGVQMWLVAYPTALFTNQLLSALMLKIVNLKTQEQSAVMELRGLLDAPYLFALAAFFVILVVPFVEEFLFRGMLLRYLLTKMGQWRSIVLSSAIFALMHYSGSQGVSNLVLLPSLFVFSCYLGLVLVRTQNLAASFSLHSCFNGFTVLLLLLNQK